MSRLWAIANKDIRESFRSRSTYLYIVILFVLGFSYFNAYSMRIDSITANNPGKTDLIIQASQSFMNSIASTLPMMFSIWICTIFATYSVVVEKAKRNLESLMVTPISLKQVWVGKSLAVALPSVIIGLGISIIFFIILNYVQVMPQTGQFIFPGVIQIVTAIILVPVLVFVIVLLVLYLQLTISNPRFANFIFLGIFFLLFFGINAFAGIGISLDYSLVYLGVIVICGGVSYLLSRFLTKERVVLSSKS